MLESSWWALLVAVIGNMVLGGLWYSRWAFGSAWVKAHNLKEKALKPTAKHYVGAFINSLIISLVLGWVVHLFHLKEVPHALFVGFLLWVGLVLTSQFSGVIWAKKSVKAFLIDSGHFLLSILWIIGILTFLR